MSESVFKVGVCGLTHGHVWGLIDTFKKEPGVQLVAVADATGHLEKATPDFARSYTDWRELLKTETLDGLIVTSNNVESSEIAVTALQAGIPCLVEKAMAAAVADAERMLAAQKASGKTLMINWPVAWTRTLHAWKSLIDQEAVGPIFHMKYRIGHKGPKEIGCDDEFVSWLYNEELNGGGAIADFGSYGAAISRWLLGMPETVYCIRGNFTKAEPVPDDHAICLLRYSFGTSLIEGTWATDGFDPSANPVAHGNRGTVSVLKDKVMINRGREEEAIDPAPLEIDNPATYFINCVRTGKPPEGILNPEIAADACRIIAAARRSNESGCAEKP